MNYSLGLALFTFTFLAFAKADPIQYKGVSKVKRILICLNKKILFL